MSQAGLPHGGDPLAAQLVQLGTGERVEVAPERQLEEVVGELGVPREHRPVRVGADHLALHRALGAVVGVADPDLDPCQGSGLLPERREAAVVLEARDQRLRAVRPRRC